MRFTSSRDPTGGCGGCVLNFAAGVAGGAPGTGALLAGCASGSACRAGAAGAGDPEAGAGVAATETEAAAGGTTGARFTTRGGRGALPAAADAAAWLVGWGCGWVDAPSCRSSGAGRARFVRMADSKRCQLEGWSLGPDLRPLENSPPLPPISASARRRDSASGLRRSLGRRFISDIRAGYTSSRMASPMALANWGPTSSSTGFRSTG